MDYSSHLRRSFVCGRALGSLAGNVDAGEGLVQARVTPHFSAYFLLGEYGRYSRTGFAGVERIGNDPKNRRWQT
jgi:hypothetical protein